MKAVILAGGRGTRIAEEGNLQPKPMVAIGGKPILWHIMKLYGHHGIREFIVCLGYQGQFIKDYFANYALHAASSVSFDIGTGEVVYDRRSAEPWRVTLVETGLDTMTGGRIRRIKPWIEKEDAFCLTYGDGLADINISETIEFHHGHEGLATVTTVAPPGRFGVVSANEANIVTEFSEKPAMDGNRINGGFFVLSPKVLDYIEADDTSWEREPLDAIAREGQLHAYKHDGFWQPMDTMRERDMLQQMWEEGAAPWKLW